MDALFLCSKNVGVATTNADLWIQSPKENETKIRMGDPVCILESRRDGRILRVRTRDYEGYVNARCIGRCSHELLEKYCGGSSFVITKRYFFNQGHLIRMGSRFPLLREGKQAMECLLPQNVFGMLVVRRCCIKAEYIHKGYMTCNPDNILSLAESADGLRYGWGDSGDGVDCSSYVGGIFRCFGIYLPRNVAQMLQLPCESRSVEEMGEEELQENIEEMGVGCLLLTNHHVMIYAGKEKDQMRFWHCSNRMGGKCLKSDIGPYLKEAVKIIKIE